jgi:hypothetical protein
MPIPEKISSTEVADRVPLEDRTVVGDKEEKRLTMFDREVFNTFVHDGEAPEVRVPNVWGKLSLLGQEFIRGNLSGHFDDHETFCRWVRTVEKELKHGGIFFTPQVVDPRLLSRSFNRLKSALVTTSDKNVMAYRWLLVDTDPVRPSGISSSDAELKEALVLRDIVAEYVVAEMGFSTPIKAVSGNGGHLLFRLPDLPVNDQNIKMIRDILAGLAKRFDTALVKIDQTVFNPARVWKLYGTTARKGDEVPAGPHREARPYRMSFIEDMGGNS